jgi:hypothetical protein
MSCGAARESAMISWWLGACLMLLITPPAPAAAEVSEVADPHTDTTQSKRGETAMTVVEVEVDIFSGMPNPTWVLTDADADAFLSNFARLRRTEAKARSGKLGYRGLIVRIQAQGPSKEIHIHDGVAELSDEDAFFLDQNRSLERWLLGTGTLGGDVLKAIDADLKN